MTSKGMVAAITRQSSDMEGSVSLTFDYMELKEHNLCLQSHDYYTSRAGEPRTLGTIFEAGLMKEDHIVEDIFFDLEDDVPVEFVSDEEDDPLSNYLKYRALFPKTTVTYLEWLEDQYKAWRQKTDNDGPGEIA